VRSNQTQRGELGGKRREGEGHRLLVKKGIVGAERSVVGKDTGG